MDENDIKLFFTLDEKEAFLTRHGYEIKRIHVEKEYNIYQNVFRPILTVETFAVKDEVKENIHQAFARLVRQKILEL